MKQIKSKDLRKVSTRKVVKCGTRCPFYKEKLMWNNVLLRLCAAEGRTYSDPKEDMFDDCILKHKDILVSLSRNQ